MVDRAVERESPAAEHRCPVCADSLGPRALIPILNWSLTCANGHRHWRYVVTDLLTAVTFAVAGFRFGLSWQLGPYLLFFAALVAMSVIDLETKLLVNVLTFPTVGFLLFAVLALSPPNDFAAGIAPALWAGGLYFAFFFIVYRIYPAGMGFGDVKLAPSLGLAIGWMFDDPFQAIQRMLIAVIIGLLSGGVIGLILQRSRKAEIPFGPFMALGTVIIIALTVPAGV